MRTSDAKLAELEALSGQNDPDTKWLYERHGDLATRLVVDGPLFADRLELNIVRLLLGIDEALQIQDAQRKRAEKAEAELREAREASAERWANAAAAAEAERDEFQRKMIEAQSDSIDFCEDADKKLVEQRDAAAAERDQAIGAALLFRRWMRRLSGGGDYFAKAQARQADKDHAWLDERKP